MAQWKETPEPYVKVVERVRESATNPRAGEDLVIGVVLISDAGSSEPILVKSQSDFLKLFSSKEVSEDYVSSLDNLYKGENSTLASTMWANAYRLAGSNTLLACRATKAKDVFYSKPLAAGQELNEYVLKDGELLKKVPEFKIVVDIDKDDASHDQDGWSINMNEVGIIGNRTTNAGPQYDYFVNSLPELVEKMGEAGKFFSPSYTLYSDDKASPGAIVDPVTGDKFSVRSVVFHEAYIGREPLDTSDPRCPDGHQFVIFCEKDWTSENPTQKVIDINDTAWGGFTPSQFYASNVYNSSSDIRVRIRRFNHDAVALKETTEETTLTENGQSPYLVLESVLNTFTKNGTETPSATFLNQDFYEVAVSDPSISDKVLLFNIGKVVGRGDMDIAKLNSLLGMLRLELPSDLNKLGLNYFDYATDDAKFVEIPKSEAGDTFKAEPETYELLLKETGMALGDVYKVGKGDVFKYYRWTKAGENQIFLKLGINTEESSLLNVSDSDLKKALDLIGRNESYIVEGLCDLGNTEPSFQSYMANMAISENYFYPISTTLSKNYMTIGASLSNVPQDSYKLYASAPWDIDTGSLGWKFYASNAVVYWEAVSRNKRNNSEFASVFGQTNGIVQYQRPMATFDKKTRQVLLTKRINTVIWNNQTSAWNMNDCYTKQSISNVVSDDGNSRMTVRISKAIPVILRQYIGYHINQKTRDLIYETIDYWFKTVIMPMNYRIDDKIIEVDPDADGLLARQSKIKVTVKVRYKNSLKYIEVYHDILDMGMSFSE